MRPAAYKVLGWGHPNVDVIHSDEKGCVFMIRLLPKLLLVSSLIWGAPVAAQASDQILVVGDSFMAAHRVSKRSIPDVIRSRLKTPVQTRAVSGARMIYNLPITGAMGLSIPQQFRDGDWDWMVMNGGGNDLWLGCGCHTCDRKLDRLISKSGTKGKIPSTVAKALKSGVQVLYVGYLRSPGANSPIESCRDEGNELDARLAQMAKRVKGVHFIAMADLVPHGDRSFHGLDMIHPSIKGSNAIGTRIATYIRKQSK